MQSLIKKLKDELALP